MTTIHIHLLAVTHDAERWRLLARAVDADTIIVEPVIPDPELVLQELRLKLASAEEEVQRATEQVARADDKLKRAVAEATATAG